MTKKVLKIEYDYNFTLIGIITSMKDYRLAHFINSALELDLVKQEFEIEVPGPNGIQQNYLSYFSFMVEESETEIYFFANKAAFSFLIPELKEVDFFLMQSPINHQETAYNLKLLHKLERVENSFLLDISILKSKENLLLF